MTVPTGFFKIIMSNMTGPAAKIVLPMFMVMGQPVLSEVPSWERPTLNFLGVPGIFDMPTAHPMSDADLSFFVGGLDGTYRGAFHFQITERLSGLFRYSRVREFNGPNDFYDRSFDIRFLVSEETNEIPAITLGLQDFGGTGVYGGEYIVATKTFGRLRATGGIGWGRFGSYNGFSNPLRIFGDRFEDRPDFEIDVEEAGKFDAGSWFRGDAAFFGGLQYELSDKLTISAEYSSDSYAVEGKNSGFKRDSPFNLGARYNVRDEFAVHFAWMYGSTLAAGLSYNFNPKEPNNYPGGLDRAPRSVAVRPVKVSSELKWSQAVTDTRKFEVSVAQMLKAEGLQLDRFGMRGARVWLSVRVPGQIIASQALGRTARALTHVLPPDIESFDVTLVSASGMAVSTVSMQRSDLEELEHAPDGAWKILARSKIDDARLGTPDRSSEVQFPRTSWAISPYLSAAYFDVSNPLRLSFGAALEGRFEPTPGLVFEGVIRQQLAENISDLPGSDSVLPHVRTDINRYAEASDLTIMSLTGTRYFRPGEDWFGKISLGYFEPMFGGISGEVLWKKVDSRLAFGLEVSYVRQRAFDQGFNFQDYNVITGHGSVYYDAPGDFSYKLDAGKYLAGDWGATISVDREFDNGVKVGAFATFTDVSTDDFGEGAFDKGIKVHIPISALTGVRSAQAISRTIRPVLRDGGARLELNNRLYEQVRQYQRPDLQDTWGRFWR